MKKILVISPVSLKNNHSGNSVRIKNLCSNLNLLKCKVDYMHIDYDGSGKFDSSDFNKVYYCKSEIKKNLKFFHRKVKEKIFKKALSYEIDELYNVKIDYFIDNHIDVNKYDIVICEYVFISKVLLKFPSNIIKIIDTHDIFANRDKMYIKDNQAPEWFYTTEKEENKGLSRADIILAIQEKEQKILSKRINNKIICLGHKMTHKKLSFKMKNENLLYLASANPINIRSLKYFCDNILPSIKKINRNINLLIAGNICSQIPDSDLYFKLGKVKDVQDAYVCSNIVINPMIYGTGLKIKSLEAISYSKLLITNKIGAEGLEKFSDKICINASDDEFINNIIKFTSDLNKTKEYCKYTEYIIHEYNLEIEKNYLEMLNHEKGN